MKYIVKGETGSWEIVVGLEIHAQIKSESKLFSPSSAKFGQLPNRNVTFIDLGFPGTLPQLNDFCVDQAIKTSLALNGNINRVSYFDRKHYFYPDLPFGYQITQLYKPIMEKGSVTITPEGSKESKTININRLHIEQDAGKMVHDHSPTKSYLDYNRAGVGLMEIVSEPELFHPKDVVAYVSKVRTILRYLDTCDGNMEEGSLRCDINISVRKEGDTGFNEKVEVKNVNSLKFIYQAIEYEAQRQVEVWEEGGNVLSETRLFNSSTGETVAMREKVEAADYRYFPDPDLLPLRLSEERIKDLESKMPELPDDKFERFVKEYGLGEYDASILCADINSAKYFEDAVLFGGKKRNAKEVASWVINSVFAVIKTKNASIFENNPISVKHLAELVDLIENKTISRRSAKDVFEIMSTNPSKTPAEIVKENDFTQITDNSFVENLAKEVVAKNSEKFEELKQGKDRLLGWFVGQVMAASKGKADPKAVGDIIKKML